MCCDFAPAIRRFHAEVPVERAPGDAVVVAVVAHGVQHQAAFGVALFTLHVGVADIAGVVAVLHPDGLVEHVLTQVQHGCGYAAFQPELFHVDVAAGVYLAVRVFVCPQVIGAPVYLCLFVDGSEE